MRPGRNFELTNLLNLFEEISEFSARFEYSHEECVFYIIISALKSHSDMLLLQG